MPNVDLVYFDAGGGHRAAALALRGVIASQGRPWNVRLVQLREIVDPSDLVRRSTGFAPEDLYNRRLARGWTMGMRYELRLLQALIRSAQPWLVTRFASHWRTTAPDLVVSVVPNFNRVLSLSLRASCPGVPMVVVMTDFADLPPRFWIEPDLDVHLVCGTDRALEQARAAGCDPGRLHAARGMVLRPDFYLPAATDRGAALRRLGLDPERPTGVVMFGGEGSSRMLTIARALDDVQLLLLCGRNARLHDRLAGLRRSAPHAAVGFVTDVPRWLRLGDFFIGKPGPGSLSEALHCGLPVITFRNAATLPQERYNTRWIEEQRVGRVVASIKGLPGAVDALLAELDTIGERVRALDNRAVFEVVDLIARLLDARSVAPAGPAPEESVPA